MGSCLTGAAAKAKSGKNIAIGDVSGNNITSGGHNIHFFTSIIISSRFSKRRACANCDDFRIARWIHHRKN